MRTNRRHEWLGAMVFAALQAQGCGASHRAASNTSRDRQHPRDAGADASIDAATSEPSAPSCGGGKTFPVKASDYDQSCDKTSDCIGIGEGDGCNCDVVCENAAINAADEAKWRADLAKTPARTLLCHCPSFGVPCCRDHRCSVDPQCSTPENDGEDAGQSGPAACVAAGGRCVLGGPSSGCKHVGAQDCNPDRNPGGAVCCLDPMP